MDLKEQFKILIIVIIILSMAMMIALGFISKRIQEKALAAKKDKELNENNSQNE